MKSFTLLVIVAVLVSCEGLSCPCHRPDFVRNCSTPTNCKGGLTTDECGCCDVCAKVLNEVCGGPWNVLGLCDIGLTCLKDETDFNASGQCVAAVPKVETTNATEATV